MARALTVGAAALVGLARKAGGLVLGRAATIGAAALVGTAFVGLAIRPGALVPASAASAASPDGAALVGPGVINGAGGAGLVKSAGSL